ncbi:MAG: GSU2403 family nucleotidyltransferase fold protein [Burkholderiales bacterium]
MRIGGELSAFLTRHDGASQTRYQELKQLARSQGRVLAGTPGIVKQRTRRGTDYWVREYIRADGRKDDQHIGTREAVSTVRLAEWRAAVELAQALARGSSRLRLLGYQRIAREPAAVLAALCNHGLFAGGLVLVGAHAYGVLVNDFGVMAGAYKTQDIDLARAQPLKLGGDAPLAFQRLLDDSGLHFVPVPGMPSRRPSTSFKTPGGQALAVDLLAPGRALGETLALGELATHAQTIPLLDFLVAEAQWSVVLSPNQVVPVKVPAAERFALHKLFSSQRRRSQRDKVRKDLDQAALLVAVLEQETPGLLADAWRRFPATARESVRRGARATLNIATEMPAEAKAFLEKLARK